MLAAPAVAPDLPLLSPPLAGAFALALLLVCDELWLSPLALALLPALDELWVSPLALALELALAPAFAFALLPLVLDELVLAG